MLLIDPNFGALHLFLAYEERFVCRGLRHPGRRHQAKLPFGQEAAPRATKWLNAGRKFSVAPQSPAHNPPMPVRVG
jgi:hypothetical protein